MTENKVEKLIPYLVDKIRAYAAGESTFLFSDQIETGKIVHITRWAGMFDFIATTEYIFFGYQRGGKNYIVGYGKPEVADTFVYLNAEVWLHEGDKLFIIGPLVAAGERLVMHVHGHYE